MIGWLALGAYAGHRHGKKVAARSAAPTAPAPTLSELRAQREAATDAMDDATLRRWHIVGWVTALLFTAWMAATVYLIPLGLLALALTYRGHRRTWARRATAAGAAAPAIDTEAEAARADELGLTESAKMWRASGA